MPFSVANYSTLPNVLSPFEIPYLSKGVTSSLQLPNLLPCGRVSAVQFDLYKHLIAIDLRAQRTISAAFGLEKALLTLSHYLPGYLQPPQPSVYCTLSAKFHPLDTLRAVHLSMRETQRNILRAFKNPIFLGYVPERLENLLAPHAKIIFVDETEYEIWGERHQLDSSGTEISPIHWSVEREALIVNVNQYAAVLQKASASGLSLVWLAALAHASYRSQVAGCSWFHEPVLEAGNGKKQSEKTPNVPILISHFNQLVEKTLRMIFIDPAADPEIDWDQLIEKMLFQLHPTVWSKAYFEGDKDSIDRTVIAYQVARLTPLVLKAIKSFGIETNYDPLQPSVLQVSYETIDTINKIYPDLGIEIGAVAYSNDNNFKALVFALDGESSLKTSLLITHELSHLFQNDHFLKITKELAGEAFRQTVVKYIEPEDNHAGVSKSEMLQIIDDVSILLARVLQEPGPELIIKYVLNRNAHDLVPIPGFSGYYRFGERMIALAGKKQYAEIVFGSHDEHWYAKRLELLSYYFAETGLRAVCEKAALELKAALRKSNVQEMDKHLEIMRSDLFWVSP